MNNENKIKVEMPYFLKTNENEQGFELSEISKTQKGIAETIEKIQIEYQTLQDETELEKRTTEQNQ